jgi:RNA polymerase sigma factor (sigma-70 family)
MIEPLIHKINKKYGSPWAREDSFQDGYVAYLEAAKDFNPEKNAKLTTYAYKCIFGKIMNNKPKYDVHKIVYTDDSFEPEYPKLLAERILKVAGERHGNIVLDVIVLGKSFAEIGREQNVSRQAIDSYYRIALKKLRENL